MTADTNLPAFDLASAITAVGLGLWEFHPLTGAVFYHTDYISALGYSPDEAPTTLQSWATLIHPADLGPLTTVIQTALDRRYDTTPIWRGADAPQRRSLFVVLR